METGDRGYHLAPVLPPPPPPLVNLQSVPPERRESSRYDGVRSVRTVSCEGARSPGAQEHRESVETIVFCWLRTVCGVDAECNPVIEHLKVPRLHSNRR